MTELITDELIEKEAVYLCEKASEGVQVVDEAVVGFRCGTKNRIILPLEDFSERYISPAVKVLTEKVGAHPHISVNITMSECRRFSDVTFLARRHV